MESLADSIRLRLLRVLERHELSVADLCDVLQLPQSTVSRHLKLLSEAAWLRHRRQGVTHLFRMILDELDAPARKLWLLTRAQTDQWPTARQDDLRAARRRRQRAQAAQSFFDGAAGQWDKLRDQMYGSAFAHAALLALIPAHWTVADLGCGTGPLSAALAPRVARVIAVDHSAAMLKAAKARLKGLDHVQVRDGALEALPLDDREVDAALMVLVLTYVPDVAAALLEAARVLKPGGRLVIVDLMRHDRDDFRRAMGQHSLGFDADELRASIKTAGFAAVDVAPLPPEPNVKGPALQLAVGVKA
jgi:ArsR family transcriptional regulator